MHETVLSLTPLEIFFICLSIISLVLNILQWKERKASKEPLSNSLVSIFNDIKSKSNNIYFVYSALFSENNPHKDIETMRWEYGLFAQSVLGYFQGFQEQLVGVLVSLKPEDKDGQQAFRAADYGLTEKEKDLREQYLDQVRAASESRSSANPD